MNNKYDQNKETEEQKYNKKIGTSMMDEVPIRVELFGWLITGPELFANIWLPIIIEPLANKLEWSNECIKITLCIYVNEVNKKNNVR